MNLDAQYITTVAFNFSRFPILKNLYYDGINTRKTIIGLSIVREKNQIKPNEIAQMYGIL